MPSCPGYPDQGRAPARGGRRRGGGRRVGPVRRPTPSPFCPCGSRRCLARRLRRPRLMPFSLALGGVWGFGFGWGGELLNTRRGGAPRPPFPPPLPPPPPATP